MALAALNFVILAVTVSSVNPRVGRSGNLVFALFAFIVYFNLLNLGQSWIAGGRVGFWSFMLLLHGGTFAAAAFWLAKQHNNWVFGLRLRRLGGRRA
jgi:lipopolysaccharide export system permease protein